MSSHQPQGYNRFADFSNEIFRIGECDLGFGMFANKPIKKGEAILSFMGPLINFHETKKRGQWECMPIQIDYDIYIDTVPPGIFVNHSCSPNAGIKDDKTLVALQAIREGEEIRFDYSTTMEESSFTMECRCAHDHCRNIIADFSTLPERTRSSYLDRKIVMGFIAKNYLISTNAS
jgi:hypothetical protein